MCVYEREREREREGETTFFVMENYAKNKRKNNKFIEDGVNTKRLNKER